MKRFQSHRAWLCMIKTDTYHWNICCFVLDRIAWFDSNKRAKIRRLLIIVINISQGTAVFMTSLEKEEKLEGMTFNWCLFISQKFWYHYKVDFLLARSNAKFFQKDSQEFTGLCQNSRISFLEELFSFFF